MEVGDPLVLGCRGAMGVFGLATAELRPTITGVGYASAPLESDGDRRWLPIYADFFFFLSGRLATLLLA